MEVKDVFSTLIVVVVLWVYTDVQTQGNVYVKYLQSSYITYASIKLF